MDEQPLHTACRKGDLAALEVLLGMADAEERLGSRDSHNRTPLHLASYENHGAVVVKLVEAGASVNATARMGFSALHFAAQANALEALEALLSKGANPNVWEARKKNTPLHLAAMKGFAEAVALLLKHGANPIAKTKKDETAFDLGRKHASVNAVIEAHVAAAATAAPAEEAAEALEASGAAGAAEGSANVGGPAAADEPKPPAVANDAAAEEPPPAASAGVGSTRAREEEAGGEGEGEGNGEPPKKKKKKKKKTKIGGMDHLLDDSAF